MKRPTPEQILARAVPAADPGLLAHDLRIDWTRPFTPQQFTQLYFTPVYGELTRAQRLRYNQLFGLRINEQFQVFESGFTVRIMRRVLEHAQIRKTPALRQCLEMLIEDEARHDRMFRRLNRLAAPRLYAHDDTYFTRMGVAKRAALWIASRGTNQLVSMVWFILLMEEYSNALSRAMLQGRPRGDLGPIEKTFQAVHRAHLRDELRHVQVDANLIDVLLQGMPPGRRSRNARLLHWFVAQVLTPKHVGRRVANLLMEDCPELRTRRRALHEALAALTFDPVMASIFHDATRSPLMHALADSYPEFQLSIADPPAAFGAPGPGGG